MGDPAVTTFSTGGSLAQQGLYYDPVTNRRTEAITVKETAPSVVADLNYTYDPAGNITKIADTPSGRYRRHAVLHQRLPRAADPGLDPGQW
jgi:hypothetical protein